MNCPECGSKMELYCDYDEAYADCTNKGCLGYLDCLGLMEIIDKLQDEVERLEDQLRREES